MGNWVNAGPFDRTGRIIIGLFLMSLGLWTGTVVPWLFFILGALVFLTGATGVCLLYRVLHVDTLEGPRHQHHAV
ncbi:MAG: YgaP family membrane protein [Clostridia bacterium]|jgi:hypothetical protein